MRKETAEFYGHKMGKDDTENVTIAGNREFKRDKPTSDLKTLSESGAEKEGERLAKKETLLTATNDGNAWRAMFAQIMKSYGA